MIDQQEQQAAALRQHLAAQFEAEQAEAAYWYQMATGGFHDEGGFLSDVARENAQAAALVSIAGSLARIVVQLDRGGLA